MPEFYDQSYNDGIPESWWTTSWRPTKWAYKKPDAPQWGNSEYYTTSQTSAGNLACVVNNVYLQVCYFKACGWAFLPILALCGNFQRESNNNPSNWEYPYPTDWTWAAVIAPRIKSNGSDAGFGLAQWTPSRTQYHMPARTAWGDEDPWFPVYYNGWYQLYFLASEVFDYPRHQWQKHRAGAGHNPATNSEYYPDYPPGQIPPQFDFRINYDEYAAGVIGDPNVQDNDQAHLDYLTECFYWNYEQVGNYVRDSTLPARQNNARSYYTYLEPIFGNFTSSTDKVKQPDKPGPNFGLDDIGKIPKWLMSVLGNKKYDRYRIIIR